MSAPESNQAPTRRPSLMSIVSGLGWPVFLGTGATVLFFVLLHRGPLNHPLMHRYFASHPVTYCETWFFLIGIMALGLKLLEVASQYMAFAKVTLPAPAEGGDSLDDCPRLLGELDQLSGNAAKSHLTRRLRDALVHVRRAGSADHLNDELKYLADVEAAAQQESYSLVRIVIWATPMLGFLGTVMGITEALGDLSANAKLLATSIDTAIQGLLGGLYVAFDTTALALTLSMVLMFIQFVIDRIEQQLLSTVDRTANEHLVGRFPVVATSTDPHVATIERMAHSVVKGTEQLVQRQAQLWQTSMESAERNWKTMFRGASDEVEAALAAALDRSLREHTMRLEQLSQTVSDPLRKQWESIQAGLTEQVQVLSSHHEQAAHQTSVLSQAITATGEVLKLEQALNANLSALAGTKNFEEMVMSLTAAIHLLTARMSSSLATGVADRSVRLGVTADEATADDDSAVDQDADAAGRARLTSDERRALRGKAA